MADASLCPICLRPLPESTECSLPIARHVHGLTWVGRQVYRIDGQPGLWQMRLSPGMSPDEKVTAKTDQGKGLTSRSFWRAVELEKRVGVYPPTEVCQGGQE